MFGAHFVGREEAQEGRADCGGFDSGAAIRFFALYDANHGGNGHAGLARRFDGVDGGGAGGAHIVDDHNTRAFLAEALDAATGTVSLFRLANEEAVQQWCAGMGEGAPRAGGGYVGDDGIGAHSETANGVCLNVILFQEIENGFAREASAFGVERSSAAIDVVVAGAAGRELELTEAKADVRENGKQLLSVGGH